MENKRILAIGGSGYIGKEVVKELLDKKYEVTIFSRNPNLNVNSIKGSVLDKELLLNKVHNFDVIIYLVAIIQSFDKSKYEENITGLKNIIEVMNANKLKKIIYFSTQNVLMNETGYYGKSKKECEDILINSDLNYLIIRPNYVYGIDKENYYYGLFKIARTFKIFPIIGNGKNKIQPVNKIDLAKITVYYVKNFKKGIINVSGKEIVSLNEIADIIKKESKLKFIKIHFPIRFLKLFRKIIPFDVDGVDCERVFECVKGNSNIKEDLKEIVKL